MRAAPGVVASAVTTHTAPTFVAVAAPTGASAVSSIQPALPTGLAQNDYMLMAVSTFSASGVTTPSGWTSLLHKDSSGGWTIDSYLFGKVAGASESAPTVARASGTGFLDATIWAYRGVSTSTPIDAAAANSAVFSGNGTQPTITTVTGNAIACYAGYSQSATASWGVPSGETRRQTNNTGGGNVEQFLGIADKVIAAAGSVTGQVWASGVASPVNMIVALALRPA